MRETLYLRLRSTAADAVVSYALVAGEATAAVRAQRAPLERVLGQVGARRLVVLVPTMDVRMASVTVPVRQAQKALQAAPYLLEDQLAEDVETLHFALGPRQPDQSYPVAVVARTRMEEWLEVFRSRGLRPDVLVPEALCLPWLDDQYWGALAEADLVTVRNGAYAGFSCPPEELDTYLQLSDAESQHGLRIVLPRDLQTDFTALKRPTELLPAYGDVLEALVQNWKPTATINLLQGSYSQREDLQRFWQPWKTAAALLVVWAGITLVSEGLAAWRLGQALEAQRQANLERYNEAFPADGANLNLLPALVARRESSGAQTGQQMDLFALTEVLARALGENPGLTLQGLQYRDGALYLSLTGSDLQVLEGLRTWFAQQPGTVLDVQSANASAEGVQLRLKIAPA